jgi:hypothetical protein
MGSTPEVKVKKKVHALLDKYGAYAVNYIGGMYATAGTPDILACMHGRFIGIEVKAGTNKPTALQVGALKRIDDAGGLALVINEKTLDFLEGCLKNVHQAQSNWHVFAIILERASTGD